LIIVSIYSIKIQIIELYCLTNHPENVSYDRRKSRPLMGETL